MNLNQFLKFGLLFTIISTHSVQAQVVQQINNSAPTETSLQITNGSSISNGSFRIGIDPSNAAFIKQYENLPLLFFTNTTGLNNERMRITSTGQVGIKETNPQSTVDIGGDLTIQKVTLDNEPTKYLTVDATGLVKYANANTNAGNYWSLTGNTGTTGLTNYLGTQDNHDLMLRTNAAPRMAILKNGKVQIGGVDTYFTNEYNTTGVEQGQAKLNVYGGNGVYIKTSNTYASPGSGTRGSLLLGSAPGTGVSSSVRLGFGGTMASGANPFLVNNSQYRNINDLFLVSRANNINRMSFILDNDADVKIGLFNTELINPIAVPANLNPEVNLTVTGHVGIQMEADDYTNNSAPVGTGSSPGPNGFALKVNGLTYSTSGFWDASDRRFKKQIEPMKNSLEKVMKLNAVNYKFKAEEYRDKGYRFSESKQFGLIAQELELVFPELVMTGTDGYKSVNYSALTTILIQAMQEQQEDLLEQRLKIRALENQVSSFLNDDAAKTNSIQPIKRAQLYQNHPNPFSEQTMIRFSIPEEYTHAVIYIFDMTGGLMKEYNVTGENSIEIDGHALKPGMYTYALTIDEKLIDSKQMILTR